MGVVLKIMAKMTVGKGLDEYIAKLQKLRDVDKYLGKVVYVGAAVVAKEVASTIRALPTDEHPKHGKRKGLTKVEYQGLVESFGIARMRNDDGYINVKLGFDGYNDNGKANAMVARSLISGTSFLQKNNFMMRAVMRAKASSEEAMKITLDKEISNFM